MGAYISAEQKPEPQPSFFKILGRVQGQQQLVANEQLDKFDAACMKCDTNRRAMQTIEACNPPPDAEAKIEAATESFPSFLNTIRGSSIVFFIDGLPHTRELATIYLPYHITTTPTFSKTLLHEAIHIHQRIFRDQWRQVYALAWDMRPWTGTLPAELAARRRLNPDTFMDPLFIWRDSYIPLMVFDRADAPRLGASHCIWLKPDGGHNSVPPPGWLDFFLTEKSALCEHPNEMAAYILSNKALAAAHTTLRGAMKQIFGIVDE